MASLMHISYLILQSISCQLSAPLRFCLVSSFVEGRAPSKSQFSAGCTCFLNLQIYCSTKVYNSYSRGDFNEHVLRLLLRMAQGSRSKSALYIPTGCCPPYNYQAPRTLTSLLLMNVYLLACQIILLQSKSIIRNRMAGLLHRTAIPSQISEQIYNFIIDRSMIHSLRERIKVISQP